MSYITKIEFKEEMREIKESINRLTNVLVGENFDGGLIKKVQDICVKVDGIDKRCNIVQAEKKQKKEVDLKLLVVVISTIASTISSLVMWLVNKCWG